MSMKKVRSRPSLKRSDTSHPDDLTAIPSCTGFKHIGDPVDGIRYKMRNYQGDLSRMVSLDLTSDQDEQDTVDTANLKKSVSKDGSLQRNDSVELGFDLMSLTARRGHFIDHVKPKSRADTAGLKHGDLVVELNGTKVRDVPHDELVEMIRQSSIEAEVLTFKVVAEVVDETDNAAKAAEDQEDGIEVLKPDNNEKA